MVTNQRPFTRLKTVLSFFFDSAGVMRLAMIGALVCLAGTSPLTITYGQARGSVIVVNTRTDGIVLSDPFQPPTPPRCTLRDAIIAANTNRPVGVCAAGTPFPAVDTILFNIGAGTPVIHVQTQLPPILEEVSIDGGSFGATRVELDGSRASFIARSLGQQAHGLFLAAGDSTIRNMVINRFNGNGIVMTTNTGGSITDYTPPTISDPSIPAEPPCYARPVEPDCPPGGGGGGSYDMPDLEGAGARNRVLGCFIGTDATGTMALGNGSGLLTAGIVTDTDRHMIGGSTPAERNVISGNFGQGLILGGKGHSVRGNFIGVDSTGAQPLGNQFDGINIAGGELAGAAGSIGANTLADPECGLLPGDDRPRCGNTIAFNGRNGINAGFNSYAILSNSIFSNGSLGIDIETPGPTPIAVSPSRNFPSLGPYWAYVPDPNTGLLVLSIDVTIANYPDQATTVQIFRSSSCDASGFGEGQVLIKTLSGLRNGRHRITIPSSGGVFTATATTTLVVPRTSEFSNCFRAGFK